MAAEAVDTLRSVAVDRSVHRSEQQGYANEFRSEAGAMARIGPVVDSPISSLTMGEAAVRSSPIPADKAVVH